MWIHTIHMNSRQYVNSYIIWIHVIMWIHTSYEFMSSCEFRYQMNSRHYVNSYIRWIHDIMWIHTSNEFTHYVNSYNQMNLRHYVNSYIIWIHMFEFTLLYKCTQTDELTCTNSCSLINLSGMPLAPREVLYLQDWELLLDLTLSKSMLNIIRAYLYAQSSVLQKIVLPLPWSTNVQSGG